MPGDPSTTRILSSAPTDADRDRWLGWTIDPKLDAIGRNMSYILRHDSMAQEQSGNRQDGSITLEALPGHRRVRRLNSEAAHVHQVELGSKEIDSACSRRKATSGTSMHAKATR